MKVAIVGLGWVGRAMQAMFPDAIFYDPALPACASQDEVNACDAAFICVPTPCPSEGALDVSIVEQCVAWCKCPLIIIRSTVNPGATDRLVKAHGKRIVFQPEYLGETVQHPMFDMKSRQFVILGGEPEARRKAIDLYTTVYNANVSIRQMSAREAEVVKLSENRAIAFKVAQCQELYDVCELAGVDYYAVRDAVYGDDPRFNLWHTFVFPDKRGMNSKCIPKDVWAWCAWAESIGYAPAITRAMLERNKAWVAA